MLLSFVLALACLPTIEPSLPPCPLTPGVRDEGVPDRRPDIKDALERLNGHVYRQGKQDAQAIQILRELSGKFNGCGPKDQASIARSFGKCLAQPRKDLEEGKPDNELYLAAAKGLGAMGKEATAILVDWIGDKRHRDNMSLQERLVFALGQTRDPQAVEPLIDLLDHRKHRIGAWAATSLENFKSAPSEIRKEAFNGVLKILVTAKNKRLTPVGSQRWGIVANPMKHSLVVLSGTREPTVEAWQQWWNKNKKRDWDAER